MCMGKRKPVVVSAHFGSHGHRRIHERADLPTAEQLIVSAALPRYELAQVPGPQHPTQHLEEADEVGLAGAVGTDQHGRLGQTSDLDISQGAETFDVDGFDQVRHRLILQSRRLWGKAVLPVLFSPTSRVGDASRAACSPRKFFSVIWSMRQFIPARSLPVLKYLETS